MSEGVSNKEEFTIDSPATSQNVALYMKMPTEMIDLLASQVGSMRLLLNKSQNSASFIIDDKTFTFSFEDETQMHECYVESNGEWSKVAQIRYKLLTKQELSEEHKEKVKMSIAEADPKSKHKYEIKSNTFSNDLKDSKVRVERNGSQLL